MLDGRWIERTCSDWIPIWGSDTLDSAAEIDAARRARLQRRIADALAYKISTWTATPPDIVLLAPQSHPGMNVLTGNPDFARILSGYEIVHRDSLGRVALRQDLVPAWEAATARASSRGEGSG